MRRLQPTTMILVVDDIYDSRCKMVTRLTGVPATGADPFSNRTTSTAKSYANQLVNAESGVRNPSFEMNPLQRFEIDPPDPLVKDDLPPISITVYSTYKLMNTDPGIMAE